MTLPEPAPITVPPEAPPATAHAELNWVMIAQAALMTLSIVIGLLVARHFPLEAYGQLSYFVNVFGTLRLITALGLTSQIVLELAQARGQAQPLADRFYPLLLVRGVSLSGMTILVLGLSYTRQDSVLRLAGLTAMLALMNDFGVGALQGLGLVKPATGVLALQPVLYAVGTGAVLWLNGPVEWVYQIYWLSFVPAIGLAGLWVARAIGSPHSLKVRWRILFDSLRFAGSMYLQAILGTVFTSYATLYYGAAGRFAEAALITIPLNLIFMLGVLVQSAMTTVYFPRLGQLHAAGNQPDARELFVLFYQWVSTLTVLAMMGAWLYPRVALGVLYGDRYQASAPLLLALAPVAYLYTMSSVLTFTVVAQGRWRAALWAPLISTVLLVIIITLTANLERGLLLAAVAHSVTALVGLAWQFKQVRYPLRRPLSQTGKHVLAAGLLLGLGRLFVPDAPERMWTVMIVAGSGAMLYLLWAWREGRREVRTG